MTTAQTIIANNKILCQFNNLKFLLTMNINNSTNKIMKYGAN